MLTRTKSKFNKNRLRNHLEFGENFFIYDNNNRLIRKKLVCFASIMLNRLTSSFDGIICASIGIVLADRYLCSNFGLPFPFVHRTV